MHLNSEKHPCGMLVINKHRGLISKDVSRVLTKKLGLKQLGHVGTLDPEAEGVLPILLGKATRLQDYLLADHKTYVFELTLGTATDSLDAAGKIVATESIPLGIERIQIEQVLRSLVGMTELRLPIYSAVKFQGKPLYEYAREGKEHLLPPDLLVRKTHIYSVSLKSFEIGRLTCEVVCGKGSYVRAIAVEIARKLGTIGYVSALQRTATGAISLQNSVGLEQLVAKPESWQQYMIKMQDFPISLGKLTLGPAILQRLAMGQEVTVAKNFVKDGLGTEVYELIAGAFDKTLLFLMESGEFFAIGTLNFDQTDRETVGLRARRLLQ